MYVEKNNSLQIKQAKLKVILVFKFNSINLILEIDN